MNQPMNIFSFNDFESTFKILNLDMTQAEFSGLMEEYGYSNEQIAAVDQVFEYLREKKVRNTIEMYLRTSRLPLKAPRTFENFDFTVIKGKHVDRLKALSCLNGLVRPACLIIDEVGHCEFDKENTRLFFDMIDRRYNRQGSNNIIFTSKKNPSQWKYNFSDDDDLLCALDRIFDDATVFNIRGDSYRGKSLENITLKTSRVSAASPSEETTNT